MLKNKRRLLNSLILSIVVFIGFSVNSAKANCWEQAGSRYNIDPLLLMAIGWKESRGKPTAVGPPLSDGNVALGLMQINTIHLPRLRTHGIRRDDLFDACTSINVGASVLRDCINKFGNIWRSVGCYYGGPASKAYSAMAGYSADVQRYYQGYINMYRGQENGYQNVNYQQINYQIQNSNTQRSDGIRHLESVLFN